MHQDAFAADYQEQEYRLIGMAKKSADICGKEVRSTSPLANQSSPPTANLIVGVTMKRRSMSMRRL
jgi:hypothetical protein